MKKESIWVSLALAAGVMLLAAGLRIVGTQRIANDFDEPVYLRAAEAYSAAFLSGDFSAIFSYEDNYEHPIFAKMIYGVALLGTPLAPIEGRYFTDTQVTDLPVLYVQVRARRASALFGVLAAGLLALINPLAGLLLAVHTFAVQYTSVVYLEAVPAFTSLGAVWAYERWLQARAGPPLPGGQRRAAGLLALSALGLGLSAASKYMYGVVGIAIALHYLWHSRLFGLLRADKRGWWKQGGTLLAWGTAALVVFLAANPYLWPDPLGRLEKSLLYNVNYAASEHVKSFHYPFWQPLAWLARPVLQQSFQAIPSLPGSFLVQLDTPIALLALIGFPRLWRRRRVYALWLVVGLVFLMAWNTHWPQYVLLILAPWCLSAAEGIALLFSIGKRNR